jgi:putative sporulation protein YyaC
VADDRLEAERAALPFSAVRVPFDDELAVQRLSSALNTAFQQAVGRSIVVVCVGTDRSTGDAFGPIVGSKLKAAGRWRDVFIYGTLDEPVHAVNLAATLRDIRAVHGDQPFVVAVDACLGKFDHVGHIILDKGPLRPGAGVKKTLPEFGDYILTGVVNVCGFMEYFVLQNTRLSIVMRMADVLVDALRLSLHRVQLQRDITGMMHQA